MKNKTKYKSLDRIASHHLVTEIWDEEEGGLWIGLTEKDPDTDTLCIREFTLNALLSAWQDFLRARRGAPAAPKKTLGKAVEEAHALAEQIVMEYPDWGWEHVHDMHATYAQTGEQAPCTEDELYGLCVQFAQKQAA